MRSASVIGRFERPMIRFTAAAITRETATIGPDFHRACCPVPQTPLTRRGSHRPLHLILYAIRELERRMWREFGHFARILIAVGRFEDEWARTNSTRR